MTRHQVTIQIWVVTRHQYGISAPVSQTSFRGETFGGVATCRLFSQAILTVDNSLAHSSLASSIRHDSRVTGTAAAGSFPPSHPGTAEQGEKWEG